MTHRIPESIRDNLRFLCVEVDSQLANLQAFFATPTAAIARRVSERDGYARNLKMRIHADCVRRLSRKKTGQARRRILRSLELVATDLDRLTELAREGVRQLVDVDDPAVLSPEDFPPMLALVRSGVARVEGAVADSDTQQALQIGRLQQTLHKRVQQRVNDGVAALKQRDNSTEDLTRALFVAQTIRQMGDVLLHLGEVIISANLGQSMNFERYRSLHSLVEELADGEDEAFNMAPIAETRSGSSISGISTGDDDDYVAIFKDGLKRKVKEERQGVESWHEIYPGLAPRILSYKKRGQSAALLIEHLPGLTFEHILLNEPPELLDEALKRLTRTLRSVWRETHTDTPVAAGYMQQLEKRLGEVYKIHPEFRSGGATVCGVDLLGFDALVERARAREAELDAPFSVYIHGDFNVDNIIYDPLERRINFIDLHRSSYMDYVQDVSVFMVSNYRLQIMDAPLRRRIMGLAQDFYRTARRYAMSRGDTTFELRLALGLARSFATSTRFILDQSLASRMFLRARYLLERVLAADLEKADRFRIPMKEIFVD
ncbi:phosphotransferase [Halomonas sp. B23F22_10]|uniref:phosphotransferase n=1 Tax=Halomonas sp. B23F22_10 TaxID=3459515 RepID=UPI00373E6C2E